MFLQRIDGLSVSLWVVDLCLVMGTLLHTWQQERPTWCASMLNNSFFRCLISASDAHTSPVFRPFRSPSDCYHIPPFHQLWIGPLPIASRPGESRDSMSPTGNSMITRQENMLANARVFFHQPTSWPVSSCSSGFRLSRFRYSSQTLRISLYHYQAASVS